MDKAYLRELAEEGAAIHSDTQPEREVCDGLLWALDEIERLRTAALDVIEFNRQHAHDQYGDADKCETWACVRTLRAALRPNG